jgi:hypothetical protein
MSVLRRRRAREFAQLRAAGWSVQSYTLTDRLRAARVARAAGRSGQFAVGSAWVSRGAR